MGVYCLEWAVSRFFRQFLDLSGEESASFHVFHQKIERIAIIKCAEPFN